MLNCAAKSTDILSGALLTLFSNVSHSRTHSQKLKVTWKREKWQDYRFTYEPLKWRIFCLFFVVLVLLCISCRRKRWSSKMNYFYSFGVLVLEVPCIMLEGEQFKNLLQVLNSNFSSPIKKPTHVKESLTESNLRILVSQIYKLVLTKQSGLTWDPG